MIYLIKKNQRHPEARAFSERPSGSHVTSVELVVNEGDKTHPRQALRRSLRGFRYAQPLKMTTIALLLSLNLSTAFADDCTCSSGGADNNTLTISNCPNGVLSYSGCANQKTAGNVIIGTGVTSIGDYAFYNASSLTSITIPEGVTSLGPLAFSGASSLTRITIPEGVTSIGTDAFYNTGLTDINCKGTEAECDALETLLEKSWLPAGINFNRVAPTQPTTASCANSGKVLQGTECVSSCGSSFRLNDGECDRIRYTPAEAAAVLKDTDNEIIMTFKVNR